MKKLMSLIKACMTENMNLFRIRQKNQNQISKKIFPIFIAVMFMIAIWGYANMMMEPLVGTNNEFIVLTVFALMAVFLNVIEGIYKTGSLLFNCKDDDLLLSLPIKKSTVLFIRILKFYLFELMYNALFMIPTFVVYVTHVNVGWTFYLASCLAIFIIPIVPIVLSCIIGGITSAFSSRFKYKNVVQILFTTLMLLGTLYLSFNIRWLFNNLAENATSINDIITKLYYPVGAYIGLINNFNIADLLFFVGIHILIFAATIFLLSKIYFKVNSRTKNIRTGKVKKEYKIITNSPIMALIKKELNRFTTSPVFVINAGFGLVLFMVLCVLFTVKFDDMPDMLLQMELPITIEQIKSYIPLALFGLICFSSFMTSITSSMISLEGKTFSLLKSLPLKPFTIIFSKILTAVLVMIPVILIGDLIFFIKFEFTIMEAVFILIASIVLPVLSATIGILINLKYPKMDADNDTEVVKQSMSTLLANLVGMILTGVSIVGIIAGITKSVHPDVILELGTMISITICGILLLTLKKIGDKAFNKINVN